MCAGDFLHRILPESRFDLPPKLEGVFYTL